MYRRLHFLYKFCRSHLAEKREKWIHWFWLVVGYFLSQVAIQALNFVSGIVILRSLSKSEYALYTIVMTLGPIIAMLSDTGIGTGLAAIGRKIWQDDERMGSLVQTGLGMRRLFGLISFVLLSPVLMWMLLHNHASLSGGLILLVIVLAGTWFQLAGGVMRMVLQLRQQIRILKNIGLATTLVRFGLIVGFAQLLFLNAPLALLAATCSTGLDTYLLTRFVKPQIKWHAPPDAEYRTSVLSIVRRTAPLTIYFCLQGQIMVWLVSIFGNTHQVADIGAVSRVGAIFLLLGSVYGTILVPRFARNNGRRRLRIQFFQILASQLVLMSMMVFLVRLFPAPLLWLLGPQYAGLGNLLWLVVLSNGLGSFLGLSCGLNSSKGWIPPAMISIPLEIATQIVLLLTLDLTKIQNVIIFSCLSVIPPAIFTIVVTLRHIAREEE